MNAHTILSYLERVANNNLLVNLLMHIVVLAALIAIFVVTNEKLRRVIFHTAISILFLSVTINALIFGNPFHGATFGILALIASVQLFTSKKNVQIINSKWNIIIAFLFIFIGLWYPEFVEKSMFMLLMVSPVGVIPCPTLLTTIGLMMIVNPSISKIQYSITLIMGFIYGIIGVFAFKVYLDITLIVLILYSIYKYFYETKRYSKVSFMKANEKDRYSFK